MRTILAIAVLALSACAQVSPYGAGYGAPVESGPVSAQAVIGTYCVASPYQCQLPQGGPVGRPCVCPGVGAPSYGVIR